jgi:hypothetical protein
LDQETVGKLPDGAVLTKSEAAKQQTEEPAAEAETATSQSGGRAKRQA